MPRSVLSALRSGRTALLLLLSTAVLAGVGTLSTPERRQAFFTMAAGDSGLAAARAVGLVDVFHGALFVSLLGAVATSVTVCTWSRLPLAGVLVPGFPGSRRRRLLVLVDAAMHCAVVVVLVAAEFKALYGFTGTKNVHVGLSTESVYEGGAGSEVPLGFEVVVESQTKAYYPVLAKIGVTETANGRRVGLLTVREAGGFVSRGSELNVGNLRFDDEASLIELEVRQRGDSQRVRFELAPGKQAAVLAGRYGLTLVAWRRDLREVGSGISIREQGQIVARRLLRVNERLSHRGWNIYLTGWGRDDYGSDYVGLQVTREPGASAFWVGSALLGVCVPAFLLLRHGKTRRKDGGGDSAAA
jgi:hypothetical protein